MHKLYIQPTTDVLHFLPGEGIMDDMPLAHTSDHSEKAPELHSVASPMI